jgi:heme-degrading monooxygenase HmoA
LFLILQAVRLYPYSPQEEMIARIWSTGIVQGKLADYQRFAQSVSLPMFKQQTGLVGVQLLTQPTRSLVITLWKDRADIGRMEQDPVYLATVAAIGGQGFLTGEQKVEVFDFEDGFLDFEQLLFLARETPA